MYAWSYSSVKKLELLQPDKSPSPLESFGRVGIDGYYRKSKRGGGGLVWFASMMDRYRYRQYQLGLNRSFVKLHELVLDFTIDILVYMWLVSSD